MVRTVWWAAPHGRESVETEAVGVSAGGIRGTIDLVVAFGAEVGQKRGDGSEILS